MALRFPIGGYLRNSSGAGSWLAKRDQGSAADVGVRLTIYADAWNWKLSGIEAEAHPTKAVILCPHECPRCQPAPRRISSAAI
jgi:hypothetical protein